MSFVLAVPAEPVRSASVRTTSPALGEARAVRHDGDAAPGRDVSRDLGGRALGVAAVVRHVLRLDRDAGTRQVVLEELVQLVVGRERAERPPGVSGRERMLTQFEKAAVRRAVEHAS